MSYPVESFAVDRLQVVVAADRAQLGLVAARAVTARLQGLLEKQEQVRMVFAAAPSQDEFLAALTSATGVDWARVTAFQMDEYADLPPDHPGSFQSYLQERLTSRADVAWHGIDSTREPAAESLRYGNLVTERPIDIVCLGIGENGHIAFNDPDVSDFDDPIAMKTVRLDHACRMQQVHDGCFQSLEDVPSTALTLTIPTLMAGAHLFCMVPGPTKAEAVRRTLHGPILPVCPASILRRHPDCTLFVDRQSYGVQADAE